MFTRCSFLGLRACTTEAYAVLCLLVWDLHMISVISTFPDNKKHDLSFFFCNEEQRRRFKRRAVSQKGYNLYKNSRVCQPVFVYAPRWMEKESADTIFWMEVYLSSAQKEEGVGHRNQIAWEEVLFLPVRLMALEESMGATLTWSWEFQEFRDRNGEGEFVIRRAALECPIGSKHSAITAPWPWVKIEAIKTDGTFVDREEKDVWTLKTHKSRMFTGIILWCTLFVSGSRLVCWLAFLHNCWQDFC